MLFLPVMDSLHPRGYLKRFASYEKIKLQLTLYCKQEKIHYQLSR